MVRPFFFLALWLGAGGMLWAQGFSPWNNRNHPELRWQRLESAHFRIVYPAHLRQTALQAAVVAESTLAALSRNLNGFIPRRRLGLYLSDTDEITNGYASPTGNAFVWVHVPDAAELFSGPEKWVRKVVAHEIAHLLHLEATRTRLGLWGYVLGRPLPRSFAEGLAQYWTESWDVLRGDLWLRTAAFDGRLSYGDGQSAWSGRLLYAVGHSQVRYLAQQYGDSVLSRLLRYRNRLGLYDFPSAFRFATGLDRHQFEESWRRTVLRHYVFQETQSPPLPRGRQDRWTSGPRYVHEVRYSRDTQWVALSGLWDLDDRERGLWVRRADPRSPFRLIARGVEPYFGLHPEGRAVVYAKTVRDKHGGLIRDLFLTDLQTGRTRRLTRGARAAYPDWSPDGSWIVYVRSEGQAANLWRIRPDGTDAEPLTRFSDDTQCLHPRYSPDGRYIAFTLFDAVGNREIALLDVERLLVLLLTLDPPDDRAPVWSPDGRWIAFTSYRSGVPNIYRLPVVGNRRPEALTRFAYGTRVQAWLPSGELVAIVTASRGYDHVYRLPVREAIGDPDSLSSPWGTWTQHRPPHIPPIAPSVPDSGLVRFEGPYRSWRYIRPLIGGLLPWYASPRNWGVAGLSIWMEPLGQHTLLGLGAFVLPRPRRSLFLFTYRNAQLEPTITFSVGRLPSYVAFSEKGELALETATYTELNLRLPINALDAPPQQAAAGLRLRHAKYETPHPEAFRSWPEAIRPGYGILSELVLWGAVRYEAPYGLGTILPLSARGLRLQYRLSGPLWGSRSNRFRVDVDAFLSHPIGRGWVLYGRTLMAYRSGADLPREYIGFSRGDYVSIAPSGLPVQTSAFGELWPYRPRVRGYRSLAYGERMGFGTLELRKLLTRSARTTFFGIIQLGGLSGAAFLEGGILWDRTGRTVTQRLGAGVEIKNELRVGTIRIAHAFGLAWPLTAGASRPREGYYRIQASLPVW
jgi:hypothetical protein